MTGSRVRSKSRRVARYWKRCDRDPAECSVAVPELTPPVKPGFAHRNFRERAGDRQNIGVTRQNGSDGSGCVQLKRPGLSEQHQAKRVVELGIGGDNAFYRNVPDTCGQGSWKASQLLPHI